MISPNPIVFIQSRCPIAPGARRSLLPTLPGWRRRRPAARSAGRPIRDRSVRSARGARSAGDVVPDCAERRLRAFGESTARRASRPVRSSASGGPAAGSIARYRDGRSPRSPPGAEASAARAWVRGGCRRSDGQPLAPLGPTTSEHAATCLRGHAGHEAMLALSRALLWLIRPLHRCVRFLVVQRLRFGPSTTNGWRLRQPAERPTSRRPARDYGWPISLWFAILPSPARPVKLVTGPAEGAEPRFGTRPRSRWS